MEGFILSDKVNKGNYCGISVKGTLYRNPIEEKSPLFKIWLEHVDIADEHGLVHDMSAIIYLKDSYQKYGVNYDLYFCSAKCSILSEYIQEYKKNFIGYDLCTERLESILMLYGYVKMDKSFSDIVKGKYILNNLVEYFFSRELNEYKLFNSLEVVNTFIAIESNLTKLYPELNEVHWNQLFPIAIYKVK